MIERPNLGGYLATCDRCPATQHVIAPSFRAAQVLFAEAGWREVKHPPQTRRGDCFIDLCPTCGEKPNG